MGTDSERPRREDSPDEAQETREDLIPMSNATKRPHLTRNEIDYLVLGAITTRTVVENITQYSLGRVPQSHKLAALRRLDEAGYVTWDANGYVEITVTGWDHYQQIGQELERRNLDHWEVGEVNDWGDNLLREVIDALLYAGRR